MINYPIKKSVSSTNKYNNTASRGMALEEMLNRSNEVYKNQKIAYVSKRPTNIKVIRTDGDYNITQAVFLSASTLDYVGVYKGHYLDFEAKETTSKKGFPMHNIAPHQIEAMKNVLLHGGISFAIIMLKAFNEIYLVDSNQIIEASIKMQSIIPYESIKNTALLIKEGYNIPVDYIKAVQQKYFEGK